MNDEIRPNNCVNISQISFRGRVPLRQLSLLSPHILEMILGVACEHGQKQYSIAEEAPQPTP